MSELIISRAEMLERMRSGDICSIVYCTLDVQKKKGGDRVELPEVTLLIPHPDEPRHWSGRGMTPAEATEVKKKNPNHKEHYTRNFRIMAGGQPTGLVRTVHIRLIEQYNGMRVVV